MWGVLINDIVVVWQRENKASAKDGEGAGRGPCGLRNSELGPRPHDVLFHIKKNDFYNKIKKFIF